MTIYLTGALTGGLIGYFVLYRLIGCASGTCPITANPYISTLYGIIMGVLLASAMIAPKNPTISEEITRPPVTEYKRMTAEEAKARMDSGDKVVVLDVRTEAEFQSGHIPNAILIPNETIAADKPELLPDLDAEILVYCRSGNRSAQAAKKLLAMGYTNVYDFGGINQWPYATE